MSIRAECISCGTYKSPLDFCEVACGHQYCVECINKLVGIALANELSFPPRCCRQPLSLGSISNCLDKRLRDKFEQREVEFRSPNRTYCCRETCSQFIEPDNIDGTTATCPTCLTATCVSCKQLRHVGECTVDETMQATLKLSNKRGWQRCRSCRRIVELSLGCHHVT